MNHQSVTHVFWSLLPPSGNQWAYSRNPRHDAMIAFMPERLSAICDNILNMASSQITMTFTGAEPVLHPYLNDILDLLSGSARDIRITLEWGGCLDANACKNVLSHIPSENGLINWHPDPRISLETMIEFASELAENSRQIAIVTDGLAENQKNEFEAALQGLGSKLPVFPPIQPGGEKAVCFGAEWGAPAGESFYCGLGMNFIRIDSAGNYYCAPCDIMPEPVPLWKASHIQPRVRRCGQTGCMAMQRWGLPRFPDLNTARKHLAARKRPGKAFASPSFCAPCAAGQAAFCRLEAFAAKAVKLGNAPDAGSARSLYEREWIAVLVELVKARSAGVLQDIMKPDMLLQIGSSPQILRLILADYARRHCSKNVLSLPPVPEEGCEPDAFSRACGWLPQGSADPPQNSAPALSVIVTDANGREGIVQSLASILKQSFTDFEAIIIDAAPMDASLPLLDKIAAIDGRIRLWRASGHAPAGRCRNFGLEMARGRYVIFLDGGDLCLPDYFERAVRIIDANQGDMAIFSVRSENGGHEAPWRAALPDAVIDSGQALEQMLNGLYEPSPGGKIFNSDMLQLNNCVFDGNADRQDCRFLFSALENSHKIVTSSEDVYQLRGACGPGSASAKRLRDACRFQTHFHEAVERIYGKDQQEALSRIPLTLPIFNIEQELLPNIHAWTFRGLEAPLDEKDYEALAGCAVFTRALLTGLAAAPDKESGRVLTL